MIKSLYIETTAVKGNDVLVTNFDICNIKNFENLNYKVKISGNAGKYLCNNIWFDEICDEDNPESIVLRITLTKGTIIDHEKIR